MTVNVLLSGKLRLDGYGQGHPLSDDGVILIPSDVAMLWRFLGNLNLGAESVFDF